MSIAVDKSMQTVSQLIQQFSEYDEIFKLQFFRYNAKTEVITLQYRLRTYQNFMNKEEFTGSLIVQYLENPIQIPSDLFYVEIYGLETIDNLALDPNYFDYKDNFFFFKLTNLFNLDSEYIDIIINSKFKLSFESIVSAHISKQPKIVKNNIEKYEIISLLKTNILPEKFQCLSIPVKFDIILNDFIRYFIPRRFLLASNKWYDLKRYRKYDPRKIKMYEQMIWKKYKITPLEFNERIHLLLKTITAYIRENYNEIIKIENLRGKFIPKIPKGFQHLEKPSIFLIRLKFETNFDNNYYVSKAFITLDFNWMSEIFSKYF